MAMSKKTIVVETGRLIHPRRGHYPYLVWRKKLGRGKGTDQKTLGQPGGGGRHSGTARGREKRDRQTRAPLTEGKAQAHTPPIEEGAGKNPAEEVTKGEHRLRGGTYK